MLSGLMRFDNAADRSPKVDFSPSIPPDFATLEQRLRSLLADREPQTNAPRHSAQQ
jgi:hypothetical protein